MVLCFVVAVVDSVFGPEADTVTSSDFAGCTLGTTIGVLACSWLCIVGSTVPVAILVARDHFSALIFVVSQIRRKG